MTTLYDKLASLAEQLEAERGRLVLFGLFGREDALGKWDLIIAAPWLSRQDSEAVGDFFKRLQSILAKDELLQLSRAVILSPRDEFVQSMRGLRFRGGRSVIRGHVTVRERMTVRSSYVEWSNCEIDGTLFQRVVFFVYDPGGELLATQRVTLTPEERRTLAAQILPDLRVLVQTAARNTRARGRTLITAALQDAIRDIIIGSSEPEVADASEAALRVVDAPPLDQVEVQDLRVIQSALEQLLQARHVPAGAASGG